MKKFSGRIFFSSAVAVLCMTCAATAQTGRIQGKILDENGEILRQATIRVENTKKGAYSDVKGTYAIRNIPVGKYSLKVSYIGYITKTIENIVVSEGQTTTANAVLQLESRSTQDVVVSATRSKDNADARLTERKNAAQVSDGVSREEISKMPDSDAGQALRRVTGVTLMSDKFVIVRGVSERYNNTTLNGMTLTSTEADKKAFAFDMFPSEFLENANVAKTFTPDLPGNFSGGLVQLNTIDFPQGFSFKISASSAINDNVTFRSNAFHSYTGVKRSAFNIDEAARSMPGDIPASRLEMSSLLSNVRDEFDTISRNQWVNIGKSFNNKSWKSTTLTANPNSGFGLSLTNTFALGESDELGLIASANYSNSFSINNMERNGLLGTRENLYMFQNNGSQSVWSAGWSGLFNLAYKIGGHSSISFKNVYNRSADDETIVMTGVDSLRQFDRKFYSARYEEKTLFNSQLAGEHTLPVLNSLFDWRFGYSESNSETPDFRRLRYSRPLGDASIPFEADFKDAPQQGAGSSGGRFFSDLNDNARTGGLNFMIPFGDIKLKTGVLAEKKNRAFHSRSFTIIPATIITGLADMPVDIDFSAEPEELLKEENFRPDGLGISEDSKRSDAYTAQEELFASYLMGDAGFQLFDQDFRFIGGARVENSIQGLQGYTVNEVPVQKVTQLYDILPSLNLLYRASKDINIRLAASQTVARPELRELAPFAFYNFETGVTVTGNPNLVRSLIQNYDVRFEAFPNVGEVFAISVFYKRIDNAIESTIIPTSNELMMTFKNAEGPAFNTGLELEARKNLSLLGEYFTNLIFNANFSWIDSKLTVDQGGIKDTRSLQGQSPYTVNFGLFFTEPDTKTSVNLAYNMIGRRIVSVAQRGTKERPTYTFTDDPHIYEMPRNVIDFSISQPIGNSFEAKFAVRDLLNQPLTWEQGGVKVASNLRGRNFTLSLGYRIQ